MWSQYSSVPTSAPVSSRTGRRRLTFLGIFFATASTASARSPSGRQSCASSCRRHSSSTSSASSLASGAPSRRPLNARENTSVARCARAAGASCGSSLSWGGRGPSSPPAASSSSSPVGSGEASNRAYDSHTLTCLVRSSRRSYSTRVRPRSPSEISKSMYAFHSASGMSSTGWLMASSYTARVRALSPSVFSSSANLIHAWQLAGFHSRYFSYSVRQRSTLPSISSSSMYALNDLSLGAMPMAMPRMRRAASRRLLRTSSLAASTQSLEKVKAWCGTSLSAARYTSRARSASPASSSSNTAYLTHR
mmetsp:Transcript_14739/g.36760  ORF Transcript_14739/g.36760 Transcript_14739/m.36760 type:complete len:307 (-) Transcript_14739:1233-2153(-)